MTTKVVSTGVTSYSQGYPFVQPWTDSTHVSLDTGEWSYGREWLVGTALNEIHDDCTIDSIKIEFTALQNVGLCNSRARAVFYDGGSTTYVDKETGVLTTSSTLYSATNSGAGITPAQLRAGKVFSYVKNEDTFYSNIVNFSLPIITITYTDRGIPYMLQFSL